jgi:hypothetical protein
MPPWSIGIKSRHLYSFGDTPDHLDLLPQGLGMTALARLGYIRLVPLPEAGGRRPTFWEILHAMEIDVEAAGWPGGPAASLAVGVDDPRVSYRLEKILGAPPDPPLESYTPMAAILRSSIAADLSAREAAEKRVLEHAGGAGTRLNAVRLPGLGTVSRHFLRYHLAGEFGDVTPEETALFGAVLTRYYQFADEVIAGLMAGYAGSAGIDSYVMVVSAYGIEPVSGMERLRRAFLSRGGEATSPPSGTWRGGPDGALLIHGPGVAGGAKLEEVDIRDVLPTTLYVLGLPVSGDLRGRLQRRLFTREHLEFHPVQIVPAYGISATPRL